MDTARGPAGALPDLRALALAFTSGVLGVHALRELPPAAALVLAGLAALLLRRVRALALMTVLGAALTVMQAQEQLAQTWPPERHNEELRVQGRIVSLPELSTGERGNTWRFLFEPEDAALPPRIRVSWYRSAAQLRGGDCWQLDLRLKTPHGSLNPGTFDYEAWLFRQGITATATVRGGEPCTVQPASGLLDLRARIAERIHGWLPEHPSAGLVAALTVGDDSRLSDADWERFRLTGTSHLVVISGFNLGIVSAVAFFLLRWLWSAWPRLCLLLPAQKFALAGSALAATAYAFLAGAEPPILRAWLMLLAVLAAAWLHRLPQVTHALALAWLVILLLDPFAVMAPGLWLSFGAVAAIAYVSLNRVGRPSWWRIALWVQLMLSLVLAPLSLYFFQGVSLAGPLVNLLAVPLFALLTPLLLAAVLLAELLPALGLPLLGACAQLLLHFQQGLVWLTQWPQLWWAASPPPAALLLALLGSLLLFVPRGLPLRPLGVLCLLPMFLPPQTAPGQGLEVTVLDVGQGLSVVLRTANHVMVYDAGPAFEEGFDAGESIVAPYLLSQGQRRVALLMLSHADKDHSGGADAVRRLLEVQDERGALTAKPCRDGENWEWDGVRFRLLHPDDEKRSDNNSGCVLRVEVGDRALLLPADIEKAAEARLLREHPELLYADVLLAPHHGSKTSSTAAFIEAVQPGVVIHSAGWRHHFGHPHPAVVARYAETGAAQYVTGMQGALRFTLGAETLGAVRQHRCERAHWWNAPCETLPAAPARGRETASDVSKN